MNDITVGLPAPAFDLPTDGEESVALDELRGKTVVLYFYPKADTPGCTNQGKDFSALLPEFAAENTVVIGVSRDTVKKLDRFKAKHDLSIILASDEDGRVCEAYGVWVQKKLYGREYMGVERAAFLIDTQGVVTRVWRRVAVKGHAEQVLDAIRTPIE